MKNEFILNGQPNPDVAISILNALRKAIGWWPDDCLALADTLVVDYVGLDGAAQVAHLEVTRRICRPCAGTASPRYTYLLEQLNRDPREVD